MLRKVDKHSGIPAYLQIVSQIKVEILLGKLKTNDQLPPVRQLQEVFDVNVNTVLRALERLRIEGVLSSEQGVGYFVAKSTPIDPAVVNKIRNLTKDLKSIGLDLFTTMMILEEVWKDEEI